MWLLRKEVLPSCKHESSREGAPGWEASPVRHVWGQVLQQVWSLCPWKDSRWRPALQVRWMLRDFQNCRVIEVSQVNSCGKPAKHLQILQKVLQKQKPAGPSRESSCWGEAFQVHPLRSVLRDGEQAYKAHNCNSYELAAGNSADYLETRNKIVWKSSQTLLKPFSLEDVCYQR